MAVGATSVGAGGLLAAGRASAEPGLAFIDTHIHPMRGLARGQTVSGGVSSVLSLMDKYNITLAILLPPPYPEQDGHTYGLRELSAAIRGNKRLTFIAGGDSLNPILQSTPATRASGALRWLALLRAFPNRFMVGSDEFADASGNRIERARRFVDLLPADIARQIASENARRVYRLPNA